MKKDKDSQLDDELSESQKALMEMMEPDLEGEEHMRKELLTDAQETIKKSKIYLARIASENRSVLDKEAPADKYFIMENGMILKTIKDLTTAINFIDGTTFSHHVNIDRNDFADWIQNAFNMKDLASRLKNATTKDDFIEIFNSVK